MTKLRVLGLVVLAVALMMALSVSSVSAKTILSNNVGASSTVWFVSGEPSLVMNGFDLARFGVAAPVTVESVTISLKKTIPQTPVDVVIYADKNGGSPADAFIVRRQTLPDLNATGDVTITLDQPVTITDGYIWAGFYLPIGFEFYADRQGSSTLTWWAWTPNGTFDTNNLASAQVFGPGNGSAPVNIDMKGVARITLGLSGSTQFLNLPTPIPTVRQVLGDTSTSLAPMVQYPNCQTLYYDSADISVTYKGAVNVYCRAVQRYLEPADPVGYDRRAALLDFYIFGVESGLVPLPYKITHCVKPNVNFINSAVIGVAYGAPRQWEILPTVRYGDFVCAEVGYAGFIGVFTPK